MQGKIYIYHEPIRHPDIIEIGRTRRDVETRNREKRSVDRWIKIDEYVVADDILAEKELIEATRHLRYNRRKEILNVNWDDLSQRDSFKEILDPIMKKWSPPEYLRAKKIKEEKKKINEWYRELMQERNDYYNGFIDNLENQKKKHLKTSLHSYTDDELEIERKDREQGPKIVGWSFFITLISFIVGISSENEMVLSIFAAGIFFFIMSLLLLFLQSSGDKAHSKNLQTYNNNIHMKFQPHVEKIEKQRNDEMSTLINERYQKLQALI